MKWAEFTIITTEEASDAIAEMLAQIGADGIAVTDPWEIRRIIEDPDSLSYADGGFVDSLGEDVTVKAYFAELDGLIRLGPKAEEYIDEFDTTAIYGNITGSRVSVDEALRILKEQLGKISAFLDIGKGFDSWKYVQDQDWENEWKKDYKAFRISDRVVICPSWETFEASPSDVVVSLDPGSAFGTGTHETTSTCAVILDDVIKGGEKVLDLGTGSGILAIICKKLGAGEVDAVDIDKLAVDVAVDNCEINGCPDIQCYVGELKNVRSSDYDIIVANIIADVIASIACDIPSRLALGGKFICSGIINTKKEMVEKALADSGFKILRMEEKNDWMAYECELS
ncbi:MAG: 50S ribosomal protein L11 methyltransferase [Clostridiales bacterium]|nr:50S ribosomal protein L11 methyltransferase [Clostridiales bacterium]